MNISHSVKIPEHFLVISNQLFQIEQKSLKLTEQNSIQRNIDRIREELKGMFTSDEAVFKILCLALRNISKRWTSADLTTGAERWINSLYYLKIGCRAAVSKITHLHIYEAVTNYGFATKSTLLILYAFMLCIFQVKSFLNWLTIFNARRKRV